jgi:DNA mismatch endonuclease (patch repair protein)
VSCRSEFAVVGSRGKVRPDFVFRRERVVVFVDGCFWHGCPQHATWPKQNEEFWRKKLEANKTRDLLVSRTLRKLGWKVLRIWEHDLKKAREKRLVARLRRVLAMKDPVRRR